MDKDFVIDADDPILVTGATGFIGPRLVQVLLNLGFRNLRCFARPSGELTRLEPFAHSDGGVKVEVIKGNLLSPEDCAAAARDAAVIFHLAAGGSGKSFPDAFMNSVVTTRNLLEATLLQRSLRRFVNVSSLAVYTNTMKTHGRLLDESCPAETHPELRDDPYCFAKVKQDELVAEYGARYGIPYVTVRPGFVYGPARVGIASRVGIDTFGVFLHLGGSNRIPFTYIDNCAEAIVLAGLKNGLDGEVFNIVDDDLPSSRRFLRLYKRNVRRFPSIYIPHVLSYALCWAWERYAKSSEYQLPAAFNRRRWQAYWKSTLYSNQKLKARTGWTPRVPMAEGLNRFFEGCRLGGLDA